MFSMFRFLMGDKSVVCRIIRLLIAPRGWSLLDYDRWRKAVVS